MHCFTSWFIHLQAPAVSEIMKFKNSLLIYYYFKYSIFCILFLSAMYFTTVNMMSRSVYTHIDRVHGYLIICVDWHTNVMESGDLLTYKVVGNTTLYYL